MAMMNPYEDIQTAQPTMLDMTEMQLQEEQALEAERQAELARVEEEKKLVQKMFRRFRLAQQARASKDEIWQVIDMFDRGEQWKDANLPAWVPKPVNNIIRKYRVLKRANLASAVSRPTFEETYPEDRETVKRLQHAHDHVWDTAKVPRVIRKCIDRATNMGTAIAMVYTDESYIGGKYYPDIETQLGPVTNPNNQLYQGKICVKRIPIQNFFPDPFCYSIEDAQYIETTEIIPFSTILNNPIFQQYAGEQLLSLKHPRPDTDASDEIFERDNSISQGDSPESGDEVVTLHTHYERFYNEQQKWQLNVTYYLQGYSIILYRAEDVQPNEYPFAIYRDEEEDQEFWGTSQPMTGLLESQKIINKVQQISSMIGALHQNPQKVVLRESGINAQKLARTGNIPGQVHESNIPNPIEYLKAPDIPRGLFELDDRTKNDARDAMGLNDAYMGNSVGSLTTSTGVDSLIERATVTDRDKMIQIDEFVERISHLIVLNIIHKWTESRPIPVPQPDGQVMFDQWQPIDLLTADNLEWRVKSNVYAKAPITQASRRQQANQLLQAQGQFQFQPAILTPEEFIRMSDFDDAEKILQRMAADRERMNQMQQMNLVQTVMQLGMQLPQMMQQGLPPEQLQQMVAQQVQQALQPMQDMGQEPTQSPSAPSQPQTPQGVTSQVAMSNMANGRM